MFTMKAISKMLFKKSIKQFKDAKMKMDRKKIQIKYVKNIKNVVTIENVAKTY